MLHIKRMEDGLELFKALGSEIRIEIIRILLENPDMSMNELASRLEITGGALTGHVKKLEECGILQINSESEDHGNLKRCSVVPDRILIDVQEPPKARDIYQVSLKVGHFSDCEVYPTCGMATADRLIGEVDDPRYFDHPDRFQADILWFGRGYVEYVIPDFIPAGQRIDQISVTAELGSEAPGVNEVWPSDISFFINGVFLGRWTSPGDFGNRRGTFSPDWWFSGLNQYGMQKRLTVCQEGTFIDGTRISDVRLDQLPLERGKGIRLRLAVEETARNVGGLTIFGKSFGNYNQDIDIQISHSPL